MTLEEQEKMREAWREKNYARAERNNNNNNNVISRVDLRDQLATPIDMNEYPTEYHAEAIKDAIEMANQIIQGAYKENHPIVPVVHSSSFIGLYPNPNNNNNNNNM